VAIEKKVRISSDAREEHGAEQKTALPARTIRAADAAAAAAQY